MLCKRRHTKHLGLGLALFLTTLGLALFLSPALPYGVWRYILGLVPLLPAIYVGYATARVVQAMDELQQRIQLEALAFSLVNTGLIALALGLLELQLAAVNMICVLPIAGFFWILGMGMAKRRYRYQ